LGDRGPAPVEVTKKPPVDGREPLVVGQEPAVDGQEPGG
jgi:hypothetical protein